MHCSSTWSTKLNLKGPSSQFSCSLQSFYQTWNMFISGISRCSALHFINWHIQMAIYHPYPTGGALESEALLLLINIWPAITIPIHPNQVEGYCNFKRLNPKLSLHIWKHRVSNGCGQPDEGSIYFWQHCASEL